MSKSHGNTSMYVDTMINSANYHIHPYTYIHTTYILRIYYVQNEWSHSLLLNSVQVRRKYFLTKNTKNLPKPSYTCTSRGNFLSLSFSFLKILLKNWKFWPKSVFRLFSLAYKFQVMTKTIFMNTVTCSSQLKGTYLLP